jgi:hypothetical protein
MKHIILNLPISKNDLAAVQHLLRSAGVFCTPFDHTNVDAYSMATYRRESELLGTKSYLLLDRNMFSRVVRLASGEPCDESMRIPAAVMAFAHCANLQIEPNIALYEYGAHGGTDVTIEELAIFRAADNVHLSHYTDVALGRSENLRPVTPREIDREELSNVLSRKLNDWRFEYTALLKLAIIASTSTSTPSMQFKEFLDWMYQEYFFSRGALSFASLYLSPKREKKMLKRLWSRNRSIALAGIRNAAWDLTLIRFWTRKVDQQDDENELWILCSSDGGVRKIARRIMAGDADPQAVLLTQLEDDWGSRSGQQLGDLYFRYVADAGEESRAANRGISRAEADALITRLEGELLSLPGREN